MSLLLTRLASHYQSAGGALACLISVAALVLLSQQGAPSATVYVAIMSGGSALVSVLLWRAGKLSAGMVLAVSALAHFIALFGNTVFEDDYYRFIWDGWRVLQHGTPYGIPPEDFFNDPEVPDAFRDILNWINYPWYPTIYGPALQILFAVTTFFGGADELSLRIAFAFATLLLSALLLRRHKPQTVALFAWNPVVMAETTLHLHPDIILALALFIFVLAGRRHPILAGLFLAVATASKLVAFAAWPMLLRLKPRALVTAIVSLTVLYGIFAFQGHGVGLDSTETFATQWYFNPLAYEPLHYLLESGWARLTALAIAGSLVIWLHASARSLDRVPLALVFGVILLFAPAVNSWYLLWLLPFALNRQDIWPYVASAVLPLSYLTGLNLEDYTLEEFQVHPFAQYAEWMLIGSAMVFDILRNRKSTKKKNLTQTSIDDPKVTVIIPALNEEATVGKTVEGIKSAAPAGLNEIIVADNGSTDHTAAEARNAGALVVSQPERGYGAACLAALASTNADTNIILFMDADLSDIPEDAARLLEPIIVGEADLVIGSRTLGSIEKGAMSAPQRFGNWLAPTLVHMIWGVRYTDLGPFRAIRHDALQRLAMKDRDFGWTIEMQVRAAKLKMRITEQPADYRKRIGVSKISGTVRGVVLAGWKILYVIFREAFGDFDSQKTNKTEFGDHREKNVSGL